MPTYRVTVPIYHTCVVEAADEADAFRIAWFEKKWRAWERDDPQPDLTEEDANIELEESKNEETDDADE